MPRVITAATPDGQDFSLNVPDRQVLVGMDGEPQRYWLHLLVQRLDGSRWVTIDPHLVIQVDDLAGEELIPVGRQMRLPLPGRPILAHDLLDDATLAGLRQRARALAEVHGAFPGAPTAMAESVGWFHADTSLKNFGEEVSQIAVADPERMKVAGHVGLTRTTAADGTAGSWVFMEKVTRADLTAWRAEKREGAGRDPRLSSMAAPASVSDRPLFRAAVAANVPVKEPDPTIFDGPSAVDGLVQGVLKSGLEPAAFVAEFLRSSGMNARSSLAIEYGYLVHALWLHVVIDRLNPNTAAMEHVCRRALQIQRAVQRSPRSPDFENLDEYLRHASDSSGKVIAVKFWQRIAERHRAEGQILKQFPLRKEESGVGATRSHGDKKKEEG